MPDIYTTAWYEEVKSAINDAAGNLKDVPADSLTACVEIVGDGASPYVADGATRRFLLQIDKGACQWYREIGDDDEEPKLDYRFRGPALAFDEVAAGLLDPVDAALRGRIRVRGDMRYLLRHAEQVQTLLEAYTSKVSTTWPHGQPPYHGDGGAA